VIAKEWLSRRRSRVKGARQSLQGKALAEGMKPPTEREIGRYPFKSSSFGDAPYLRHPEPGRQCRLAAKRPYLSPSGLALDVIGQ
jgi:hypothetical protein